MEYPNKATQEAHVTLDETMYDLKSLIQSWTYVYDPTTPNGKVIGDFLDSINTFMEDMSVIYDMEHRLNR